MDPYRPNQYGYRPPQPMYGQQQQFPPAMPNMRPHYSNLPPPPAATGTPFNVGRPGSSPAVDTSNNNNNSNNSNEKLTTLFVGAIAPGVSDAWIEKLLQTCGKLTQWKRVKDPTGKPKGFGFATYEDPESALSALRVLGGEATDGVVLKAMDGSQTEKKLIVKADDNVRTYLEGYQQQNKDSTAGQQDSHLYELIQKYVHAIEIKQEPDTDHSDALDKELAFFKERAVQKDQERKRNEDRRGRRGSAELSRRRGGSSFSKGAADYNEKETLTDEEIERRRKEKHERDVENAYRQREKRFENREKAKLHDYEKDMKREKEIEENEAIDREYWMERLANWDDLIEMEKGEALYYSDRSRWRKMRENIRRRENDHDDEDRRREIHEIEEAKARALDEEQRKKESSLLTREAEEAKIALKPTKINFSVPIKRNANLGGVDEDEDEDGKKKRRVLVPLDYSDLQSMKTDHYEERISMSTEERARRVKELIDAIPSSQNELWEYAVKWDELDEHLIETKLHSFVSKKIVDLLGMEEDNLVNFVLNFIRERKGPNELVQELEGALDEDALVFVMKLWRALIFETERRHQKL
ncbi:hypothetical protein BDB01DRAFT_769898 [Pilobolus umbonatus]|nr:hypothetical protein BDB01DRAFT_769898 [Pilobolus umbonatus]